MGQAQPIGKHPSTFFPTPPGVFIGQVREQPNSCAFNAAANVCYQNGEFEALPPDRSSGCCYIGGGSNYGIEYVGGTCAGCPELGLCLSNVGSGPVRCRQIAFNADPTQCAFTGVNPQLRDGKYFTCDPKYLPGGSENVNTKRAYCAQSNNFFQDPRCTEFCQSNDCTTIVNAHCQGDQLTTDTCKRMCFSSETGYDCDLQLREYCSLPQNEKEPVCQCFLPTEVYDRYYTDLFGNQVENAQAVINQVNKLPTCSFTGCSTSNFKPRNPPQCPTQAVCVNSIQFNSQGEIVFKGDANFQQTCRQELGVEQNKKDPPIPTWSMWTIIAVSLAFVVALALAVWYFYYSQRNNNNNNSYRIRKTA